jgi:fatty-acyl-CoA synthase
MNGFTVAEMLRKARTCPQDPDAVAVIAEGGSITYAELDERTDRLADALRAEGFTHGERLGLLMGNRIEWLELFFAFAKLGGVVVPLNHLLRPPELAEILEDCGATWLAFEPAYSAAASQLSQRRRLVCTEPGEVSSPVLRIADLLTRAVPAPVPAVASAPRAHAEDLLLLQYTSGTTGAPKGVMHTHATVLWNSYHQIVDYGVTADEVWLVVPALCWAAGLHDLALPTLWAGGKVVLAPVTGFDPARLLKTVEAERVTGTLLVPSVLKRVLAAPEIDQHDLSSLRYVLSGGEPVPVSALEDMQRRLPGCRVSQVYGMSEFPTLMLRLDADDAPDRQGSTGRACSIAEIRVVDQHAADVAAGEVGEIICRSPATLIGYWNKPEATAAALVDGWLHTGDLATVDADGFVYICGRQKDMLITGGLNVYPAEVERAIAEHPAVIEAAVIAKPDPDWGEVGRATVVLHEPNSLDESTLTEHLRARLATFKLPRTYSFTTEPLPRTTSGKVQKFRL